MTSFSQHSAFADLQKKETQQIHPFEGVQLNPFNELVEPFGIQIIPFGFAPRIHLSFFYVPCSSLTLMMVSSNFSGPLAKPVFWNFN